MVRTEIQLAWKTQAGHRHQVEGLENEDAVFVTQQHPLFDAVLMVADGMGGHPRPREASEVAVRTARELLFDPERLQKSGDVRRSLAGAVAAAHRAVAALRKPGGGKAPGTTLSVAVVMDGALHVAHVGDGSVLLMREGQARAVAGGEDRRSGNRPAQFLGQEAPLEPEFREVPLREGDRLLLCTDGLTRYFREAGPEALERVMGRSGVEIQSIASQLTAHSRPDDYDDDTTVALAEVTGFAQGPARKPSGQPAQPDPGGALIRGALAAEAAREARPVRPRRRPLRWVAVLVAVAGLVAAGFAAGRWTAPEVGVRPAPVGGADQRQAATAAELRHLPAGNVVLLDELGRRVFTLSTRGAPLGDDPVDFQAFKVGAAGRFEPAGRFRLDPAKGILTDAEGRRYPVELDYTRGAIRVLRKAPADAAPAPASRANAPARRAPR
jgi:protein phosphatase